MEHNGECPLRSTLCLKFECLGYVHRLLSSPWLILSFGCHFLRRSISFPQHWSQTVNVMFPTGAPHSTHLFLTHAHFSEASPQLGQAAEPVADANGLPHLQQDVL
jgi:hypothetical protein